ncbi:recombination protein NinG [Pseudoduganella chitinolytica]|uniref:Recombination protein NinG n=1 Tax=Pseudoduganella chitinolytica TaxID=34070 RepID=A0ABY8BG16_9BURK|nr:recombination protein NinG [Pseudoduganella chitinolytica]WEF34876.1 recombination protein NinG [Pseudoduganella chitinolytica]
MTLPTLIRRQPLRRTAFKRNTKPLARLELSLTEAKPKGVRVRKCSNCGTSFQQQRMGQQVCGPACAQSFARRIGEQQERKADRERKQQLKTRSEHLADAQAAFNAYIRARDAHLPCISCGRYHTGAYDAGHYRSVGAQPALRFHEDNTHRQCVPCNQHKSGNAVEYRLGLIARIGAERVAFLELEHPPAKYTIEDAQRIKAEYRAKLKQLKETA